MTKKKTETKSTTKKPLQNTANFVVIQDWIDRVPDNHTRGVTFRTDNVKGKRQFQVAIISTTAIPRLFQKATAEDSFAAAAAWANKEIDREIRAAEKAAAKDAKEAAKEAKAKSVAEAKARVASVQAPKHTTAKKPARKLSAK